MPESQSRFSNSVDTVVGPLAWNAKGGGPTLLLLHGLLTNSSSWNAVVEQLSSDFRCVTVDLPLGSHPHPADAPADLTVAGLAEAVCQAAEQLCPDGFVLIGSDTGGVVAQLAALRRPNGLQRLILLSCDTERNFLPPVLRYLQVVAHVPGTMFLLRQALKFRFIRRLPIAFGWLVLD